jgi:hypothetical protein
MCARGLKLCQAGHQALLKLLQYTDSSTSGQGPCANNTAFHAACTPGHGSVTATCKHPL